MVQREAARSLEGRCHICADAKVVVDCDRQRLVNLGANLHPSWLFALLAAALGLSRLLPCALSRVKMSHLVVFDCRGF